MIRVGSSQIRIPRGLQHAFLFQVQFNFNPTSVPILLKCNFKANSTLYWTEPRKMLERRQRSFPPDGTKFSCPRTRVPADPGRRPRGAVRASRGLRLPSSTLPRFEVFDVLRPARASPRSALRTRRRGKGAPPLPAFHSERPGETKYSPNVMLSTLTRDADGTPHINKQDDNEHTGLQMATMYGNVGVVRILLSSTASASC